MTTRGEQVVSIPADAVSFTAVCERCTAEPGVGGAFAARLDLDLRGGVFLCRGGHQIRVERAGAPAADVAA